MKYTEYTDEQIQEIKRQRDRRKRMQITVIVFILGVLFALVGILERGGAIYLVLGIACLLMGVLLLVDHIRMPNYWDERNYPNGRRKPRSRMQQMLTRSKPCHLFTDSLRKIPCPEGAFHDKMIL